MVIYQKSPTNEGPHFYVDMQTGTLMFLPALLDLGNHIFRFQVMFAYEAIRRLRPHTTILCLHGKLAEMKRVNVYQQFCNKQHVVLLATDIAARGLGEFLLMQLVGGSFASGDAAEMILGQCR